MSGVFQRVSAHISVLRCEPGVSQQLGVVRQHHHQAQAGAELFLSHRELSALEVAVVLS